MKKIAVTGAGGFVGSRICQYYQNQFEVTALSHKDVDITSKDMIQKVLSQCSPDYVIHCAAISDTGYAQEHPGESYAINVCGSVNLAAACKELGAKFIYMSSDQVYTGSRQKGAIAENTKTVPENEYGKQKLEAERYVQELLPEAIGLRLTWMFDMPCRNLKTNSNLIWNIMKAMLCHTPISFRDFEYRGISYVWETVERLEQILELPGGVYNFGSENTWSTYETARFAAGQLGCSEVEELIRKVAPSEEGTFRNLSIDMGKMGQQGVVFSDTQEGIRRCVQEYFKGGQ